MRRFIARFLGLFRGRTAERELAREIDSHLALIQEDFEGRGLSPEEARLAALRVYGGVELAKELQRETRSFVWIEQLFRDLHYGGRNLLRNPGLTSVALLSLALGIGANTAIFSILNAVMLKLLPVKSPDRLIELRTAWGSSEYNAFSYPALEYFSQHTKTLEAVIAAGSNFSERFYLADESGAGERVAGQFVNGDFFSGLGVPMTIGRPIAREDDRKGQGTAVAVISYRYWERRFGADLSVIGRRVAIEDHPFTIVGVTSRPFTGIIRGNNTDLWVPFAVEPRIRKRSALTSAGSKWIRLVGRLNPGVTLEEARAELNVLFQGAVIDPELALRTRQDGKVNRSSLKLAIGPGGSGESSLRRQFSRPLLVLMAITGIVLLIACANLVNLLLARSAARQREMAVRLAIGAGRGRLVRQLLTESFLLCIAGLLAGLAVAWWTSRWLLAYLATGKFPVSLDVTPDLTVLGFTAAAAIITTIVTGLAPALKGAGVDLSAVIKGGVDRHGLSRISVSKGLVIVQMALLVVLVVGAGLFLQSLRNLHSIDLGFRHDRVLLINVDPSRSGHSGAQLHTMFGELLRRMERVPGVDSATLAWISPITGGGSNRTIVSARGDVPDVHVNWVAPKYFATLGTPIVAGRDFDARDSASAARVTVITQTLARRLFGDDNPVGKLVSVDKNDNREVIGVVGDSKYMEVRQAPPPTMYLSTFQKPSPDSHFLIGTAAPPAAIAARFRTELESITKSITMGRVQTLREQIDASLMNERLLATLSGGFGALALLLAAIGLYGVIAYTVTRRTREIGIRTALGAKPGNILAMVLKETALLVLAGLALGLPLALALSQSVEKLLYGIKPDDARVTVSALATLFVVALGAGYLPARRAARVDPLRALRHE